MIHLSRLKITIFLGIQTTVPTKCMSFFRSMIGWLGLWNHNAMFQNWLDNKAWQDIRQWQIHLTWPIPECVTRPSCLIFLSPSVLFFSHATLSDNSWPRRAGFPRWCFTRGRPSGQMWFLGDPLGHRGTRGVGVGRCRGRGGSRGTRSCSRSTASSAGKTHQTVVLMFCPVFLWVENSFKKWWKCVSSNLLSDNSLRNQRLCSLGLSPQTGQATTKRGRQTPTLIFLSLS